MGITARDEQIKEFLAKFKYATTNQIHTLFFNGRTLRMAQERLKKLVGHKYIRRVSTGRDSPYCYTLTGKYSAQLHHHLMIVDVYLYLKEIAGNEGELVFDPLHYRTFKYNGKTIEFVPDAFIMLQSKCGRKLLAYLEVELQPARKVYSKIKHYELYYLSGAYRKEWWYALGKGEDIFPRIIVLSPRADKYRDAVKRGQRANLTWQFVKGVGEI